MCHTLVRARERADKEFFKGISFNDNLPGTRITGKDEDLGDSRSHDGSASEAKAPAPAPASTAGALFPWGK